MKLHELMDDLHDMRWAVKRQSWKNKQKVLFVGIDGALSVAYINKLGVLWVSRYVLYRADLKADDWVRLEIDKPEKEHRLACLEDILKKVETE